LRCAESPSGGADAAIPRHEKTGDGEYRLFSTTVYGMRLPPANIGRLCDSAYSPYIVGLLALRAAGSYMLEYSSIRS
jgi:hypothetical protein